MFLFVNLVFIVSVIVLWMLPPFIWLLLSFVAWIVVAVIGRWWLIMFLIVLFVIVLWMLPLLVTAVLCVMGNNNKNKKNNNEQPQQKREEGREKREEIRDKR